MSLESRLRMPAVCRVEINEIWAVRIVMPQSMKMLDVPIGTVQAIASKILLFRASERRVRC